MDKLIQRRRVPRRSFVRWIGVLISGQYKLCQTVQIGEGGMMIELFDELKTGQQVVVSFFIPGVTQAVVRATVRYIRPDENLKGPKKYGLQFEALDFNTRRQIRNYVAAKSVDEAREERTLQKTK